MALVNVEKFMRVAIPVSNGYVDSPGEGLEIYIYEVERDEIRLLEKYENPALKVSSERGVRMIKSILDRGVDAVIVSEIGEHGIRILLAKKITVYLAPNMRVEEALSKLIRNELPITDKPTHHHHHHHHEHKDDH